MTSRSFTANASLARVREEEREREKSTANCATVNYDTIMENGASATRLSARITSIARIIKPFFFSCASVRSRRAAVRFRRDRSIAPAFSPRDSSLRVYIPDSSYASRAAFPRALPLYLRRNAQSFFYREATDTFSSIR